MTDPAPDAPNSVPPSKPAIQSTTIQGALVVIAGAAFAAAPTISDLLAHKPPTLEGVITVIGAASTMLGAAATIYGRLKAVHPIAGLIRTPGT